MQNAEFSCIFIFPIFFLYPPTLPLQFFFKLFLGGQVNHVFGGKQLLVLVQRRLPGNGLVFFRTQNQADGWVIIPGDKQVISATSSTRGKILEWNRLFLRKGSNRPKLHKPCGVCPPHRILHKPCGESSVPGLNIWRFGTSISS